MGIDFGTTRTALSIRTAGDTVHVGTPDGLPMPSLVAVNRLTGETRVGEAAAAAAEELDDTHLVIRSVKSHLSAGVVWEAAGRGWTTADVSSHIRVPEGLDRSGQIREVCWTAGCALASAKG